MADKSIGPLVQRLVQSEVRELQRVTSVHDPRRNDDPLTMGGC